MKKILITGAHGAIGRHIAVGFARSGASVIGLGHGAWSPGEAAQHGIFSWHSSDVTLDALVTYAEEPDIIVHCAGSASVGFSVMHPHEDYARTVASTAAVLEYIRLCTPKTVLVYPSSAAVYGSASSFPIAEGAPLRPISPYGTHKLMSEELCSSYGHSYGLAISIIRLFSVYGEGFRKQLLWDACRKARAGDCQFSGTGAEIRDWLHAEDATSLINLVVSKASPHVPIFNAGVGDNVTVKEVVTEIFRHLNPNVIPVFGGTPRPGDPAGYLGDSSYARSLGWAPKIDWRSGVRRYVDWFRAINR